MADQITSDVRTLLDRTPFDTSTVADLREALGRDASRYKTLREAMNNVRERGPLKGTGSAEVNLRLGVAEVLFGHYQAALNHLEKAGDSGMAHFHRGLALQNLQRWADAAKAYGAASESGYDQKVAVLHRAGALRQAGDIAGAKTILKKMEGSGVSNAEYHFQRGCMLVDEGELISAATEFERAKELDRDHAAALFQLAYIYDLRGSEDEAMELYRQCIRKPPVPVAVFINLGILLEDENRYREAEECYQQVLSHLGTEGRARLFLKDCRASRDMYYDESLEKQYDKLRTLLEIPVTDFELSVRSRNCLRKMNIRTLGDLTRTTEAALLASKNFGETSLAEIKEMMSSKGVRLGMALEAVDRVGLVRAHQAASPPMIELSQEERAALAKPISDLSLSVRAKKAMSKLNIQSLSDLIQRTGDELLECKNFGVTSLNEVREKLQQHGLKLRND
jgi:DNA-directed RNA polymerase subunit alpha